jgi:2,3-dihydroxybenzoate-AMP ligase
VVVPAGAPPDLAGMREFLSDAGLADFKLPDRLELVDELPMTPVGKVDKATLRARYDRSR